MSGRQEPRAGGSAVGILVTRSKGLRGGESVGKVRLGLVLHLTAWKSRVNGPERKRRWLSLGKS